MAAKRETRWTLGIDPPQGWGAWSLAGPLAFGWGKGSTAAEKRRDLIRQVASFVDEHGPPTLACIEKPWGVPDLGHVRAIIEQAIGHGELTAYCRMWGAPTWEPMAGQWRRYFGLARLGRNEAKSVAVRLSSKAWEETRGGVMVAPSDHAHEALLMAGAAWLKDTTEQSGCALRRYIKTGSFKEGSHGEGAGS